MSCQAPKIYKDDVGTIIELDTGVDITAGSVFEIKVKLPDATLDTWTATLLGQTKIRYVTVGGDLPQAGIYKLQAHVVVSGWNGLGETVDLEVLDAFA